MGAKRLYLCNLIPLWELDDEKLDVDWESARARKNDIVELRVRVHDLPLALDPPDFTVRYEIKESDFLLSGGLDDEVAKIEGPTKRAADAVGRPFKVVADRDLPRGADRLKHIFLTETKGEGGRDELLVRCYWQAEERDDVSGQPEYYFDFTLDGPGGKREERSDRELVVESDAGGFGKGLGLRPGELARAAELGVAPAPLIAAAGWSKARAALGEEVELVALVTGALPDHPLTFEILDNPTPDAEVLERIDTVVEGDGPQRARWTPPRPFPVDELTHLAFRAYIEYVPEGIAYSASSSPETGGPALELHGRLELQADLRIEVVDDAGRPQAGVEYRLETPEGRLVAEGRTDKDGRISVPPTAGTDHRVLLKNASLVDASEPDPPERPPPDDAEVVFSVVRLLPPPSPGPTPSSPGSAGEEEGNGDE